jgi:hypothetical protein
VVERPPTEDAEPVYGLRHLQRFGLATPFKQIVQDVARLADNLGAWRENPGQLVRGTVGSKEDKPAKGRPTSGGRFHSRAL